MDNKKSIREFLKYLDGLESLYSNNNSKSEKSRRLISSSISQIRSKVDVLSRILEYVESDVDFNKDNYIRLGDFLSNLNKFKNNKYYSILQFSNVDSYLDAFVYSYNDDERIAILSVPPVINETGNNKRLEEIVVNGKRYSSSLNFSLVTDKKMVNSSVVQLEYTSDIDDLVINTKWITKLSDEQIAKAVYKCIVDDKEKGIDRKSEFLSQYKTETKSPVVSLKVGELMKAYQDVLSKDSKTSVLLLEEKHGEDNYGKIEWSFFIPYSSKQRGGFYFSATEYENSKELNRPVGKTDESMFVNLPFDLYSENNNPNDNYYRHGIGLNNLLNGANAKIVIDINLQDKYLREKNNKPLLNAVIKCIQSGRFVSIKNFTIKTGENVM